MFIGSASHAIRDLELQGQTILLFSKFIVAIDLLGIFVSTLLKINGYFNNGLVTGVASILGPFSAVLIVCFGNYNKGL